MIEQYKEKNLIEHVRGVKLKFKAALGEKTNSRQKPRCTYRKKHENNSDLCRDSPDGSIYTPNRKQKANDNDKPRLAVAVKSTQSTKQSNENTHFVMAKAQIETRGLQEINDEMFVLDSETSHHTCCEGHYLNNVQVLPKYSAKLEMELPLTEQ